MVGGSVLRTCTVRKTFCHHPGWLTIQDKERNGRANFCELFATDTGVAAVGGEREGRRRREKERKRKKEKERKKKKAKERRKERKQKKAKESKEIKRKKEGKKERQKE